jgi:exopolyphosphatase / guanosine-5'-triphosphate,3'-diphosphate pyrophosphatase
VANLSKILLRAVSSGEPTEPSRNDNPAPGRLPLGKPVAVIDIGSNSVRLVVYEGISRSPTPIFNEKVLCGLGREVSTKGKLNADAVDSAIGALKRFRALCDVLEVGEVKVIATAAVREAKDGPSFIRDAEKICRSPIEVLSGKREARLAALGVIASIYQPDGVAGDLGGGSLELVEVRGNDIGIGQTLPFGGLALADLASHSLKKAGKLVSAALEDEPILKGLPGRTFYAVGGTWRALARLHMRQTGYPLHVMHGYSMSAKEAIEFADLVQRVDPETLDHIESIAKPRRELLPYGALVLGEVLRIGKPKRVVISALGVREGLLYELLDEESAKQDPLIAAASDLNILRSRSPRHGEELIAWTDVFMGSTGIEESPEEKRLRHAACLLADIGWRAHPEYRGEQSLNIISHAAFVGIDHPGRAFLALAVFYRHAGLGDDEPSPHVRELATTRILDRARVLGAAFRVAYLVSASMPGVLPKSPLKVEKGKLVLRLEGKLGALDGERLFNRVRQLAKLIGREPAIRSN